MPWGFKADKDSKLYLTHTDTSIGFVSQDPDKIDKAKRRKPNKHYIKVVNSLETLKTFSRVPNKYKKQIRQAKRTTFIMPNGLSLRVVKNTEHNLLLDRLKWVYSSSANLSGAEYDEGYARDNAEVVVFFPKQINREASKIYRLSQNNIRSIRR